jgi:tetratricopeptide (TPR) repeat protein
MLDVQMFGLDAGAHHLVSLGLHVATTVVLFMLFLRMTGAFWKSAFVAALFAVHPLHVESVAWVAERKDVLSALFWVLTLWAYVSYVRKVDPIRARAWYRQAPGWYAATLVLFALGLMSKPMVVTLPFVLLLLDVWPLARARGFSRRVVEKIPLFALAAASSAVTFVVQRQAGAVKTLDALPLGSRLANAVVAYIAYIGKTVWPAGLAAIYPYSASLPAWQVLGSIVCLLVVTVLAVRAWSRRRYLLVGWLWYVGTLVPVIGLIQVGAQPIADRYMYVPAIGLFIIVAWGVPDLLARWKSRELVLGTAALAAVVLSAATARVQAGYWRDSVSLWEHAIRVTDLNYHAHANLGQALAAEHRLSDAVAEDFEAIRIKPGFAEAHNYLGLALAEQGHTGEAVSHYAEAVRLMPAYVSARNNLGLALAAEGRIDAAMAQFSEVVRLDPENAAAHANLGIGFASTNRLDDAVREFSEALRIQPDSAQGHVNLALALTDQGNLDEAIGHCETAVRLEPTNPAFHYDLGVALAKKDRTAEAIQELQTVLKIDPSHQGARDALTALIKK